METQVLRGKRSRSQLVKRVIRQFNTTSRKRQYRRKIKKEGFLQNSDLSGTTHHFPLGAEVGVALQCPIQRVLGDVGKHLVVQLVHRAVGYPAAPKGWGWGAWGRRVRKTALWEVLQGCMPHQSHGRRGSYYATSERAVQLFYVQRKREHFALHVPVYGDVLQEFAGGAVLQDDALRGDLEGDLRSLLPASFSLLHKHNMQQLISFQFFFFLIRLAWSFI